MAENAFGIAYDGPDLETGRMPVRDLAPALLALGELFADASVVVYPDREPVALNIEATARGSFLVRLILESAGVWDNMVDLLGSNVANALSNLTDLVVGAHGLFWFMGKVGKRRIRSQEPATNPGHVRLSLEDETTIEVRSEVLDLYEKVTIRRKARQVVEPLTREGIESVRFVEPSRPQEPYVVIEKRDVSAFELPVAEDALLDHETEMILEIVRLSFQAGAMWRFTDGSISFAAPIEDEDFWRRVEDGVESFRMGDLLRCRVRMIQTQRVDGLHTDWRIIEVLQHLPRPEQLRLES